MIAKTRLTFLFLLLWAFADRAEAQLVVPLPDTTKPVVRLTFNGQAASFLFDTGAGAHTLASWFVDAAGMAIDDSHGEELQARDSAGESVALRVLHGEIGRLPNGDSLFLESAIVADFPPMFEEEKVGGLINPQFLAGEDQAVVLDMRVPELRIEDLNDAIRRTGAQTLADNQVQVCVETDAPVPNLLYAIQVTTEDGKAWLGLDTGAGKTSISAGNPLVAGLELEAGGETMGVAGRPQPYSIAPDLQISFAGFRATVDAKVVEMTHGGCGSDGLLGRDALNQCALVLTRAALAFACNS